MPPSTFLEHLALQLRFRADQAEAIAMRNPPPKRAAIGKLHESLHRWREAHRLSNACGGTIHDRLVPLHRTLGAPHLNAVQDEFDNWRAPERRHDLIPRVLRALGDSLARSAQVDGNV